VVVDFGADETPGSATWSALGFLPAGPLRFAYAFHPVGAGCGLEVREGETLFTVTADGDLDGDGQRSHFERRATLDATGQVVPLGVLQVRDRVE